VFENECSPEFVKSKDVKDQWMGVRVTSQGPGQSVMVLSILCTLIFELPFVDNDKLILFFGLFGLFCDKLILFFVLF
jgi:hypothetical protein